MHSCKVCTCMCVLLNSHWSNYCTVMQCNPHNSYPLTMNFCQWSFPYHHTVCYLVVGKLHVYIVPVVVTTAVQMRESCDYYLSCSTALSYSTRTQLFTLLHTMGMRPLWTYFWNNQILKLMQLTWLAHNYSTKHNITVTTHIIIVPGLVQLISKLKNRRPC